jgi:hypothetical protein
MNGVKTCLVLGASASAPYKLPTGAKLRDLLILDQSEPAKATVAEFLPILPDEPTYSVMNPMERWQESTHKYLLGAHLAKEDLEHFRKCLFLARSSSVDRFIQHNEPQWGPLGRRLLAHALLNCEKEEWLDKDWYQDLFDIIAPTPESLVDGMLSVITFNYDRSFERFFRTAFQYQFGLAECPALELYRRIKIEHVYGDLGTLDDVPYGAVRAFGRAAGGIKLVRTGEDYANGKRLEEMIKEANNVAFIGFSFADENFALFKDLDFRGKNVFLTTYNLSPTKVAQIRRAWPWLTQGSLYDGTARSLLHNRDIFAAPPAPTTVQAVSAS